MNKSEYLQTVAEFLSEMIRTVNIFKIGAMISEAKTDQEREYLSQALTIMLNTDFKQINRFTNPGSYQEEDAMFD